MLLYGEGHYQRAVGQFERAYSIIPGNYNFGLSLAVALSRAGRAAEGLSLLEKNGRLLNAKDPEYGQKLAYQQFFQGMILMYDGRYGDAIGPASASCPVAEKAAFHEAVWLHHPLFLGERADVEQLVEAITKIARHADELAD